MDKQGETVQQGYCIKDRLEKIQWVCWWATYFIGKKRNEDALWENDIDSYWFQWIDLTDCLISGCPQKWKHVPWPQCKDLKHHRISIVHNEAVVTPRSSWQFLLTTALSPKKRNRCRWRICLQTPFLNGLVEDGLYARIYPLVNQDSCGKSLFFMGKSTNWMGHFQL